LPIAVTINSGLQFDRAELCIESYNPFGNRSLIRRLQRRSFDSHDIEMLPSEPSLLVLHEIRELNKECEILILSNPEQIRDRVTALIQGADDYLLKPLLKARCRIHSTATISPTASLTSTTYK
jgi:DNA-binding response OmpR family regulator